MFFLEHLSIFGGAKAGADLASCERRGYTLGRSIGKETLKVKYT